MKHNMIPSKATKQYVGVKLIESMPMFLGDYNTLRGWTIPEDEDPKTDGYLITYPDGYISWSPKDVFEKSYLELSGKLEENPLIDTNLLIYTAKSLLTDTARSIIENIHVSLDVFDKRFYYGSACLINGQSIYEKVERDSTLSEEENEKRVENMVITKVEDFLRFLIVMARNGVK